MARVRLAVPADVAAVVPGVPTLVGTNALDVDALGASTDVAWASVQTNSYLPDAAAGILEHRRLSATVALQRWTSSWPEPRMYLRRYHNGVWSAWTRVH